ncbi:MAG: hypothetical protein AAFX94_23105, partial [Myxococcota bacterium]
VELPLDVQQSGEREYTFTGTPLTDNVENQAPEGLYRVIATLTDQAENRLSEDLGISVELDQTAPSATETTGAVLLTPDPRDNLLRQVEHWRPGTGLEITFVASEPSESSLVLRAADGTSIDAGLVFSPRSTGGQAQILTLDSDASTPVEGVYFVDAVLVDRAGNTAQSPLTDLEGNPLTLTVDMTAPAAPAVDDPDAVRYLRAPWGEPGGGSARSLLQFAAAAIEDDSTLIAYADASGSLEVGRVDLRERDLAQPVDLQSADRSDLFIQAVDRAGNGSPVVRVRDVEWRASLSREQNPLNPHRFFVRTVDSGAIEITGQDEVGAGPAVASPDGSVSTTEGRVSVVRAQTLEGPSTRSNPAVAYDPSRDV